MRLFIILFTLIPLVFIGIGTGMAVSQHKKITTYQPVEATVLRAWVDERVSRDSDGHRSRTYTPKVEYRYTVNGREYTNDDVQPLRVSSGRGWAHNIVRQYKKGATTRAWYNPGNPAQAFLLKKYTFFPYLFILFPMIFLAIAAGMAFGGGASRKNPPAPGLAVDGRYELRATSTIAGRRRAALIASAGWMAVGVFACGHYFSVATPPYGMLATIATGFYAAAGLIPVGLTIYYFLLGRNISDSVVLVKSEHCMLGDEVEVEVQQTPYRDMTVEKVELALVCEATTKTRSGSKTTIDSDTCYEDRATVFERVDVRSGEALNAQKAFAIPEDQQPTTSAEAKGYPRYSWWLEVNTEIADSPDYRAKFPIVVRGN